MVYTQNVNDGIKEPTWLISKLWHQSDLISQNERIFVYPSHYLSQYHIDAKVINIGVKVLGWLIDPKGIKKKNKEILKYL